MSHTNELFLLIKSLNKSEKGYFKKFSAKHVIGGSNNYIKLFDAINNQENYNEKELDKKFRNYGFTKQLPRINNYLYNLILKCLNNYCAENSINIKLKTLFLHIEILFDRGLYRQCKKIILKAKKIAIEYERQLDVVECNSWLLKIMDAEFNYPKDHDLNYLMRETFNALDNHKNFHKFQQISLNIGRKLAEEGAVSDKKMIKKINSFFNNPILKDEKNAQIFMSKHLLYYIHFNYFVVKNDFAKANIYIEKAVKLWETNPPFIADNPSSFLSVLNNYLVNLGILGKFDSIPAVINKLNMIPANNLHLKNKLNLISLTNELFLYMETGQFEKGLEKMPFINEILENCPSKTKQLYEIIFHYDIAYLYFGIRNYKKASEFLNKVLNIDNIHLRPDIHCISRIFNLILLYEKEEYQILEYAATNTKRFIKKKNKFFKFESIMVDFFLNKIPKFSGKKEKINCFKNLKHDIIYIDEIPSYKNSLVSFNITSWIESKIKNKPLASILINKPNATPVKAD